MAIVIRLPTSECTHNRRKRSKVAHHLNLMTYCGSTKVPMDAVRNTPTPEHTDTWFPIPHASLVDTVQHHLEQGGLKVIQEVHAMSADHQRYFGLMQIGREVKGKEEADHATVVGLRNTHDKRFPAGLIMGDGVFVCDNLCFSAEVKLARKHTRHIMRDLPGVVSKAVSRLNTAHANQEDRITSYKQAELVDSQVHDILIRALDARVISSSKIAKVLKQWRTPDHPEFAKDGKTVWRLRNAFTEVLKAYSVFSLPAVTEKMNGLLDAAAGFVLKPVEAEGEAA